jgi:hypothetical protein
MGTRGSDVTGQALSSCGAGSDTVEGAGDVSGECGLTQEAPIIPPSEQANSHDSARIPNL